MSNSNKRTRFYIYAIALLPVVLLFFTGAILLKYHTGASPENTIFGGDANFWFSFHKITALISVPLIVLHLFVKTDWVKRFFTHKVKGAFKTSNTVLFILFLLCVLTALGSALINKGIGGIHNKLGIILIIVFIIHLWNYRKVIINQAKKILD